MNDTVFPLARDGVVSLLRQFDISPTRQRVEIAEYLFQCHQHLSADQILEGVTDLGAHVSRATVYNTMGLFSRKGVVREVLIDRERVFYDSNLEDHQHLYNIETGELTDIYDADLIGIAVPNLPDGCKVVATDVVFKVSSK